MGTLKRRVEELERLQLSHRPRFSRQFDDDALTTYNSEAYLDSTMEPSYHDIESTAIYARGKALRSCGFTAEVDHSILELSHQRGKP
jgi:hypothetical protein